jgi:hypothetical protein
MHPFADGNGRVARAVASAYECRAASIPLLVLADQRSEYFSALERADGGSRAPFVSFVDEAARSAISMVTDSLRTALGPKPEDVLVDLKVLLTSQGALAHPELDAVAVRLAQELMAQLDRRVQGLELPPGVRIVAFQGVHEVAPPVGFRAVAQQTGNQLANTRVGVSLQSAPPAQATRQVAVEVFVSDGGEETETFVLAQDDPPLAEADVARGERTEIALGLRDAYPELTVAARYRLEQFVERILGRRLNMLVDAARASSKQPDG